MNGRVDPNRKGEDYEIRSSEEAVGVSADRVHDGAVRPVMGGGRSGGEHAG